MTVIINRLQAGANDMCPTNAKLQPLCVRPVAVGAL